MEKCRPSEGGIFVGCKSDRETSACFNLIMADMSKRPQKPSNEIIRRLILLRHAKSAWPEGVADKKRPLAARGAKAAPLIGEYMAREGLIPDLALVSTARRTQETWALVRKKLPGRVEARDLDALYEASTTKILEVLAGIEPGCRYVLIIGHNPGIEQLALLLAGAEDTDERRKLAEKFPTAGLAVIDFDATDWREIGKGSGRLERFVTPRSLE